MSSPFYNLPRGVQCGRRFRHIFDRWISRPSTDALQCMVVVSRCESCRLKPSSSHPQGNNLSVRQTDRYTDRQTTDTRTDRQIDRQTDRPLFKLPTERQTDRQTDCHRHHCWNYFSGTRVYEHVFSFSLPC